MGMSRDRLVDKSRPHACQGLFIFPTTRILPLTLSLSKGRPLVVGQAHHERSFLKFRRMKRPCHACGGAPLREPQNWRLEVTLNGVIMVSLASPPCDSLGPSTSRSRPC